MNTPKHTMSSRLRRRERNFNAKAMSLMVRDNTSFSITEFICAHALIHSEDSQEREGT